MAAFFLSKESKCFLWALMTAYRLYRSRICERDDHARSLDRRTHTDPPQPQSVLLVSLHICRSESFDLGWQDHDGSPPPAATVCARSLMHAVCAADVKTVGRNP